MRYDNHAFLASLHRLVGELGVDDAVHFLGQRTDVPAILTELDLSLLPSWEEPFGLAMVESMAMGTPPLSSSAGAGPELLRIACPVGGCRRETPRPGRAAARSCFAARAPAPDGRRRAGSRRALHDDAHAREMLEIYQRAAGLRRAGRRGSASEERAVAALIGRLRG